jgi:hypothetical protein
MKLSDIVQLLRQNGSPSDWMQVNNENGDGGYTMVCLADVLLQITLNVVWKGGKPATRL